MILRYVQSVARQLPLLQQTGVVVGVRGAAVVVVARSTSQQPVAAAVTKGFSILGTKSWFAECVLLPSKQYTCFNKFNYSIRKLHIIVITKIILAPIFIVVFAHLRIKHIPWHHRLKEQLHQWLIRT